MMKFARNIHFQIKEGKETEFSKIFETNVLPILRKQNGFKEELTLISKEGALGISLWDNRESADTYNSATYPRVVEMLQPVISGTPKVTSYEVGVTTLHA